MNIKIKLGNKNVDNLYIIRMIDFRYMNNMARCKFN